ncbi:MAG: hypothetical protein WCK67_07450 [bacterium]
MIKNNKNYYSCENVIYVKSFMDGYYFEQNGIILDFKCPNCNRKNLTSNDSCKCGYSFKKKDNFWTSLLLSWIITALIIICGVFTVDASKTLLLSKIHSSYSSIKKIK